MNRIIITLSVLFLVTVSGCKSWQSAKPALRTVDSIAEGMCGLFWAEAKGFSVQDAISTFCDTREKLEPWIDQVLATQRTVGAKLQAEEAK